jgi:hypothetical protein
MKRQILRKDFKPKEKPDDLPVIRIVYQQRVTDIGGYLAHLRHIDFSPTQKSSLPQHG